MPLWTPTEIGSLVSRWKASLITGLSDGAAISTWEDSVGSYDATASLTDRPTYETNELNGKAVTRWNGSNAMALGVTDLFRNISGGTLFAVKKDTATTTRSEIIHISRNSDGSTRAVLESGGSGDATKHEIGGRRLDANSYARALGSASVDNAWRLVCGVFDYANTDIYLYLDGVQDASNTSFQTAGSTSDTSTFADGMYLGASAATANRFTGDIAEILVFHSALSTADRQTLEGYAAHEYGLTANLAADHPYKSAAPTTGNLLLPMMQMNQFAGGTAL